MLKGWCQDPVLLKVSKVGTSLHRPIAGSWDSLQQQCRLLRQMLLSCDTLITVRGRSGQSRACTRPVPSLPAAWASTAA